MPPNIKTMIWIILSVLCSTSLVLSLKLFSRYNIDTFQVILFNYLTCVLTAWGTTGSFPLRAHFWEAPWFPIVVILAFFFIAGFNLVALTVKRISVTVATILQKMSLVMTVLFAFFYYHEQLGLFKIAGILIALAAIILTNMPANPDRIEKKMASSGFNAWILPLITFLFTGMVDVGIFYSGRTLSANNADPEIISAIFACAGLMGLVALIAGMAMQRIRFDWRTIFGGVIVGIPNYGSIYFLMKSLSTGWDGSVVFPVTNMAIIVLSTLLAVLLYSEKLGKINVIGVILSVLSIALIAM